MVAQAKRLAALGASRVDFLHVYDPPWHRLRHVMPALSASELARIMQGPILETSRAVAAPGFLRAGIHHQKAD